MWLEDGAMKLTKIIAAATTAAVLTTGAVTVAGAASGDSGSKKPAATAEAKNHPKKAVLRRLVGRRAAILAAKTIGITPKQLVEEVKGGKTVGQVASDHGSSPTAVINALVAAGNKAIDNQVAKHHISADRAAKIKAKLPEKVTNFVNNWHPKTK
jgi:urease alpha subunit